jgi:HEPN domain-containing protein
MIGDIMTSEKWSHMLTHAQLKQIARARLKDAAVLFHDGRFDGAYYICGYAVEIALKARIVKALKWAGYPSTGAEFSGLQSLKTHHLETLLKVTGWEAKIKAVLIREWSAAVKRDPESRYSPIGTHSQPDTESLLRSCEALVKALT